MATARTTFWAAIYGLVAMSACDPPQQARGEPPPVVEAAPVEPEPPQMWPPGTSDRATSDRTTTADRTTTPDRTSASETPDVATKTSDRDASAADTSPAVRAWTEVDIDAELSSSQRVRGAKAHTSDTVKALFADAGVDYPPGQLLFRGFKHERELEVWASAATRGPLTHVTTYSICAASGKAGPKRREGDWQVPEGFYKIDVFNAHSKYHLAMRVDYPNARDRALRSTGGQIMIHGDCASIGCLAMSDERIEELWVMAGALRSGRPHVHLFPARDLETLIAGTRDPELAKFWEGLRSVDEAFIAEHVIPRIAWDNRGVYRPKG